MADRDEDHRWLAARERGDDVSHVPAEARAPYEAIGTLIEELPQVEPPAGWKQRTLAMIDQAPDELAARRAAPRPSRGWLSAAAVLVAAAVVLVVLVGRRPERVALAEPVVRSEVRRAGTGPSRGTGEAALGDTLVVHAEADQAIELRVYGDTGELLARCTDSGGCQVVRDGERRRYTLELELRATGEVRTVLFVTGGRALAAHDLDGDLQAAHDAGLVPRPSGVIHVR